MAGLGKVPLEAWRAWQEPYRVTYREYVENQREKDAGVYAIQAGLAKARIIDRLEPGWKSILKAHYGAIALGEYVAAIGEAHMARFGADSAWRNTALTSSYAISRSTCMVLPTCSRRCGGRRNWCEMGSCIRAACFRTGIRWNRLVRRIRPLPTAMKGWSRSPSFPEGWYTKDDKAARTEACGT
ncbi:MAG: hypothetical protein K6U87_08780 [Firmicutes bacterium]|nr:hypothetical protein [Bacillota bacterium]